MLKVTDIWYDDFFDDPRDCDSPSLMFITDGKYMRVEKVFPCEYKEESIKMFGMVYEHELEKVYEVLNSLLKRKLPMDSFPLVDDCCDLLRYMFWKCIESDSSMAFLEYDEIPEVEEKYGKKLSQLMSELENDVKKYRIWGAIEHNPLDGCYLIGYRSLQELFKYTEDSKHE